MIAADFTVPNKPVRLFFRFCSVLLLLSFLLFFASFVFMDATHFHFLFFMLILLLYPANAEIHHPALQSIVGFFLFYVVLFLYLISM